MPLTLSANKSRQALKALEDSDFDKVISYLEKSVERDSLNPNTEYVYALLYFTDSFPAYDLDRAHEHILKCVSFQHSMTDEHTKEMIRSEITIEKIQSIKSEIDIRAFVRATALNTINEYEYYISNYEDSEYLDSAIAKRNLVVFELTQVENTWQAYERFFIDYPEADQVPLARKKFNQLVFDDKVGTGEIDDWVAFLKSHPGTPYRDEVETKIYKKRIASLDATSIYKFVNTYHNPRLTRQALNILYYTHELNQERLNGFNHTEFRVFQDSISKIEPLNGIPLVPLFDKETYKFIDLDGQQALAGNYSQINPDYFCGNVLGDVLEVMSQENSLLINRKGAIIFDEAVDEFRDVGEGVVIVERDDLFGAIHKAGFEILPFEFESLDWLGSKLFVYQKDGLVGLLDFGGNKITEAIYDDIYMEGKFWVFEQSGKFALSNYANISSIDKAFSIDFGSGYEEVELIESKYIIAYTETGEVLIDENLTILTPEQTERINTRFDIWVLKINEGFKTFEPKSGKASDLTFDVIIQNSEWLGLKRNNKWEVHSKNLHDDPIVAIDSLKLLGQDIAIVFRKDEGMAIFPNKEIVYIKEGEHLSSIKHTGETSAHFMVVKRRGRSILYRDGVKLFETDYDEIGYISDESFYVVKNGKYGAVNEEGRLVMRVRYDAITEAENGVSSVLYEGNFGAFNFEEGILLNLGYEENFLKYGDNKYIVKEDGLYGILERRDNLVVDPEFEEVAYWSDSTFWGKEDGLWFLLSIGEQKELLGNVVSFKYLKESSDERIIAFETEEGYGVYNSSYGIVVPPVFNDVYNVGSDNKPLYFAEQSFPEAEFYLVVYYSAEGEKIKTASYRENMFAQIVCDK